MQRDSCKVIRERRNLLCSQRLLRSPIQCFHCLETLQPELAQQTRTLKFATRAFEALSGKASFRATLTQALVLKMLCSGRLFSRALLLCFNLTTYKRGIQKPASHCNQLSDLQPTSQQTRNLKPATRAFEALSGKAGFVAILTQDLVLKTLC